MIQNILAGQKMPFEQLMQQQAQPMQQPAPMMQPQPMQLDPYGQQMGNLRQILMGGLR